jgi:hypothetical protein
MMEMNENFQTSAGMQVSLRPLISRVRVANEGHILAMYLLAVLKRYGKTV